MHCERSGKVDTGAEIAKALEMNYIFISEFDEIHHPTRKPTDQGGGIHGNAILTKFDIGTVRTLSHFAAYQWERDGHLGIHYLSSYSIIHWLSTNSNPGNLRESIVNEPRKGERFVLATEILTPLGPVYCYCLHLEVFCGILDRLQKQTRTIVEIHEDTDVFIRLFDQDSTDGGLFRGHSEVRERIHRARTRVTSNSDMW